MHIWKQNDINRAYEDVLFIIEKYHLFSDTEKWSLLFNAIKRYYKEKYEVDIQDDGTKLYFPFNNTK